MENVPNEVLEKIFSYVPDRHSLFACRQVGKRWNAVAVKFWRQLSTVRVQFLAAQRIREFLSDMEYRIQDFPFTRFAFTRVNSENLAAVNRFLCLCSPIIRELDIRLTLDSLSSGEWKELVHLITCLDTCNYPILENLRVELCQPITVVNPELRLPNLRILRLPFAPATYPIPAALIKGAPNLQLLEIHIDITSPALLWPLPDKCKEIEVIQVDMFIDIYVEWNTTTLEDLLQKLEEWSNIRVQSLSLAIRVEHTNLIPRTTLNIQRLLDGQADFIKTFVLRVWPSTFSHHLRIPAMTELYDFYISFDHNRNPLRSIEGNPFSRLQTVTLFSCMEPTFVFRSARLETVQTFVLDNSRTPVGDDAGGNRTHWDKVFPNLTSFTYRQDDGLYPDFSTLQFLVSVMRMDSLASVNYKLLGMFRSQNSVNQSQSQLGRINRIFSGYDDLDQIVAKANEAREQGADAEELYWQSIEHLRRPCLGYMKGLKNFQLDLKVDDNFAIGVLLRLKPLDLLTVNAKKLSLGVFGRIIARHHSFCSSPGL